MIGGTARNDIARLQPINDDKPPKMNVPTIVPRLLIDPSHEISEFDKGPVFNGVSADKRTFIAGESQPDIDPCAMRTVFAERKLSRKNTFIQRNLHFNIICALCKNLTFDV